MRSASPENPERDVEELFSSSEISSRVARLGAEIRDDAGAGEIFLIGILKGSSVFLADLLRAISGKVRYEWVNVLREIADTDTADALEIDFLTHFDMAGRNVYVVKDVVTSGIIENYLLTQFRERHPAALKLVTLLDCPTVRTVDLEVDFAAFTVERGMFVGYGLELDGNWANLPFIGRARR